ncbi:MAG: hypothetical protein A2528_00210 [Candidatus Staskawiczbacteria bacterium RIFOXYD2_FULL_37_9]|uniref:Helix-turn-helix domain-containing protein n=1 Tax=Candidatus Staskawiczbacteria bacterium RIFOXYB1_FULL_37_44 TaxID=1802223 RepID=A0A1G2ITU1_9BACT|nr:MAG: hypothetical protein A2358_03330 [Candidatus Staskawiczbacteria bacterium RIFOXYB1_FULL_37_44]OGZ90139.1 MAG: hypothetical protein A2581_01865 [Candidatus Staskawiczbacteria bacterium RIFOXYD1_FULL_37_110]OGZ93162.1 MAG: hypothetical protein A2528_00210 [Candidatus Staskawiczbacteria bacterium RIFOXYD2_FULL_37_9]
MTKEYYSTIETANIFRVSRKTVFLWIKMGKIEATKVGRNFIVPHSSIVEKLGKTLGTEKKAEIETSIDRAMKDFEQTFRKLGKE